MFTFSRAGDGLWKTHLIAKYKKIQILLTPFLQQLLTTLLAVYTQGYIYTQSCYTFEGLYMNPRKESQVDGPLKM